MSVSRLNQLQIMAGSAEYFDENGGFPTFAARPKLLQAILILPDKMANFFSRKDSDNFDNFQQKNRV